MAYVPDVSDEGGDGEADKGESDDGNEQDLHTGKHLCVTLYFLLLPYNNLLIRVNNYFFNTGYIFLIGK